MAVVGGRLSTFGAAVSIQQYATGWGAPRGQCDRRALLELKLLVASGHQAVLTAATATPPPPTPTERLGVGDIDACRYPAASACW